jgi:hypothetical protein
MNKQINTAVDFRPRQADAVSTEANRRLERLGECVKAALAMDDPLEASLGAMTGDLMFLGYRLRQALERRLDEGIRSADELTGAMPALDAYLRVTKQVDRFSRLAIQLRK